jgi:hypothetical protein
LREVFCPVLKFKEEKRTFAKVEGVNVDFFLVYISATPQLLLALPDSGLHSARPIRPNSI